MIPSKYFNIDLAVAMKRDFLEKKKNPAVAAEE